jgi:hypothetical protein
MLVGATCFDLSPPLGARLVVVGRRDDRDRKTAGESGGRESSGSRDAASSKGPASMFEVHENQPPTNAKSRASVGL